LTVAVVADSGCDLPEEFVRDHGIRLVPLTISFGTSDFRDGLDLPREKFWEMMKASNELPRTAAPSQTEFETVYQNLLEQGHDGVLCLTMSSVLSATYQSAVKASSKFGNQVEVIDTRTATLTEGLIVLRAAEVASAGASLSECVSKSLDYCGRSRTRGALDTLENLRKGGRIGAASALLGSVMAFKPMIEVADGEVKPVGKQRTRKRSVDALLDWLAGVGRLQTLGIVHAMAPDLAEILERITGLDLGVEPIVSVMGATIGTHAGPGALGIGVVLDE
jgi:DegV family protein with EDD domain